MSPIVWMEESLQDLRFGVRYFRRSPGLTAIAVLSLALGIMATTAMYSVIHAVVLDPFPYKDVDSLMSVKVWSPGERGYRTGYTTDQFLEIAERNSIFQGVIASTISDVLWLGTGEPQRLRGNYVTTNTFEILGVPPLLGRAIQPDDGRPDAPSVCVLGHRFWMRQFGGDRAALGKELFLNGKKRLVVGIMPQRFMWRGADVYIPIVFQRGLEVEGVHWVHLLGRLKPGVTEAQAEADLKPIIEDLKKREPGDFPKELQVGLLSFMETFPSSIRESLWILFGAVGLLLLIACANVSNLLLSKATARQKEMAVRASIGASRLRLIRQLLSESSLLALAGAFLGVVLARPVLDAIIAIVPPNTIPDESKIVINLPVLLFSIALTALTALLFGMAPALHACTKNLSDAIKDTGQRMTGGFRQAILRNSLVVLEVALSLMLLVSASLMIRSLLAVQAVDPGFRAEQLLVMRIPLSEKLYAEPSRRVAFFQTLLDRVSALPGVTAAGLNTSVHPFGNWRLPVEVPGQTQKKTESAVVHQINSDYPKALGIAMVQGRLFTESELAGKQHLAVVNQTFIRKYLEAREPLGRVVRIPRLKNPPFSITDDSFQIIGVIMDRRTAIRANEMAPEIYIPYTIAGLADRLVVRAQTDAASLAGLVRQQVYAVDKDQPVTDVRPVQKMLEEFAYSGPRFNLTLFSLFAAMGLALAIIGVYAVISHAVGQRTKEIGVRMALGASPKEIGAMVLARGATLLLSGIGVGLTASLTTVKLLSAQIWNVSPFDPLSFGAVAALLLVAGLQACVWPARRAARIDPMTALRREH